MHKTLALALLAAAPLLAQDTTRVASILPARNPLPAEAASARVTRFSFIAYGDTRGRRDGVNEQYEHSLIVDDMLRTIRRMDSGPGPVKFVVQTGDAVVNGRDAKQWNVSFVGLINRITQDGGVPYFLAPGNHDVSGSDDLNSPARRQGLTNYLNAMAQLIPPDRNARRLDGYPTYAFGYGNTFLLAMDSNIADDTVQYRWIVSQLEGLDRRRYVNVVAFFHHPFFTSGPHGGAVLEPQTAKMRARYLTLFRQHGVKLVLTGHDHLYDHFVVRWRDSARVDHRMDQIVTGGGGAPLYPYTGEPNLSDLRIQGRDTLRIQHIAKPGMWPGDNAYHYVVVHVDGPRLWIEVVGVDWGRTFAPYRSNQAILSDSSATR